MLRRITVRDPPPPPARTFYIYTSGTGPEQETQESRVASAVAVRCTPSWPWFDGSGAGTPCHNSADERTCFQPLFMAGRGRPRSDQGSGRVRGDRNRSPNGTADKRRSLLPAECASIPSFVFRYSKFESSPVHHAPVPPLPHHPRSNQVPGYLYAVPQRSRSGTSSALLFCNNLDLLHIIVVHLGNTPYLS